MFFAKYLFFQRREDHPAILRVRALDGRLSLRRQRIPARRFAGVFDLLLKPIYTACRVWLPRHPFRSVVSV